MLSVSQYMQKVKSIGKAQLAISKIESDHNLVMTVLLGLPEEYRGFVSALNTQRKTNIQSASSLMMQEEIEMQHRSGHSTSSEYSSFYANREKENQGDWGGRFRGGRG